MRIISSFNFTTLNGFLNAPGGDISWHRHGADENQFAAESLNSENILLFGRITYEMMAGYWPTPMAMENDPTVAKGMNGCSKIVFSNSLKEAEWNNTTILSGNIIDKIRKIKQTTGNNMTILGSGSIVSLFAENNLIDSFQIMVDPVAIPAGEFIFKGIKRNLNMELTACQTFKSGVVLLSYKPLLNKR